MKNKYKMLGIVLLLIGIILTGWLTLKNRREENLQSRKIILSIRENIDLGDSESKVKKILDNFKNGDFDYYMKNKDLIVFTTPLEFGASNWRLLIELKDSKVVSIKIRSDDSDSIKPDDAPNDLK